MLTLRLRAAIESRASATRAPSSATSSSFPAFSRPARTGFADGQATTIEHRTVELLNRRREVRRFLEFDKREASRSTGLPVGDDVDVRDRPSVTFHELTESLLLSIVRQITNVQTRAHLN